MVDTPSGNVFIHDCVSFRLAGETTLGKVLHLFCKVSGLLETVIIM